MRHRILYMATAVASAAGLFLAQGTVYALPARVSINPFTPIMQTLDRSNSLSPAQSIINNIQRTCKEIEIYRTDGCPETGDEMKEILANAKQALRDGTPRQEVMDEYKNNFRERIEYLSGIWDEQYGGENRGPDKQPPIRPSWQYDAHRFPDRTERALQDPFSEMLDWVQWWDIGSYKPSILRTEDKALGGKMLVKFIKRYCDLLEIMGPEGCKDPHNLPNSVSLLQEILNTTPSAKTAKDTIISTFNNEITWMREQFQTRYEGDQRPVDLEKPAPVDVNGAAPFDQMLSWIDWWDAGRLIPGVLRTKYGPQLINWMKDSCARLCTSEGASDYCGHAVSKSPTESDSLWKELDTRAGHLVDKDNIIGRFKSDVEWLRDNCQGQPAETDSSSNGNSGGDNGGAEQP